MDRTITFKMTHEFELTFEDFFERFYNAGQMWIAKKVWEKMTEHNVVRHTCLGEYDEWDNEISEMQREAEKTIEEEELAQDCRTINRR
jgi:hypothetical protein